MSKPEHGTRFDPSSAVLSAVSAIPDDKPRAPNGLSPEAQAAAAKPYGAAYSPIVLAGLVRLIEFCLVMAVGLGIYLAYVVRAEGFAWYYVVAIFGIALLALLAFQAADIYQVQAFRGYEKQYMRLASAWSVVFSDRSRRLLLRQNRRSIFARVARRLLSFSGCCVWSCSGADCFFWCAIGRARAGLTGVPSWSAPIPTAKR